jgi:hypothetical protein
MKKYLVFAWDDNDARGGNRDFRGTFDTVEECRRFAATIDHDMATIVEAITMTEVDSVLLRPETPADKGIRGIRSRLKPKMSVDEAEHVLLRKKK